MLSPKHGLGKACKVWPSNQRYAKDAPHDATWSSIKATEPAVPWEDCYLELLLGLSKPSSCSLNLRLLHEIHDTGEIFALRFWIVQDMPDDVLYQSKLFD